MNLILRNQGNPFDLFQDFEEDMSRLFTAGGKGTVFGPHLDMHEEGNDYILKADLPGIRKEDLKVTIADNVLTIQGERKSETEKKDKNYYRVERWSGSFERSVGFPAEVDASKVKASFKDGVLELTVPKSEKAQPKQIEIDVK
jgi:HSP20 family protein